MLWYTSVDCHLCCNIRLKNYSIYVLIFREKLDMELKFDMSLLAHINAKEKLLQDASQEKVRQAMNEFTKMVCSIMRSFQNSSAMCEYYVMYT